MLGARKTFVAVGCLGLMFTNSLAAYAQGNPLDSVWARLGNIYVNSNLVNTNDASEVEIMLKGGIDRAAANYGKDSGEVVQAVLQLCRLYKMQQRYGEMRPLQKRLARIFPELSSDLKAQFAPTYLEQARELVQNDKYADAKTLYSPIMEHIKTDKTLGSNSNTLLKVKELAYIFLGQKKDNAATEAAFRALVYAYEHQNPIDEGALADARTELADVLLKNSNNITSASELASLALDGQEKTFGVGNARTAKTLILLCNLNLMSNHTNEATQLVPKIVKALEHATPNEHQSGLLNPLLSLCTALARAGDEQSVKLLYPSAFNVADQNNYGQFETNLRELIALVKDQNTAESFYTDLLKWSENRMSALDNSYRSQILLMITKFYADTRQFDKLQAIITKLNDGDKLSRNSYLTSAVYTVEATKDGASIAMVYELLADRAASNPSERQQATHYRSRLGRALVSLSRYAEAKKRWYECIDILRQSVVDDCKDLPDEVKVLLDYYIKNKRYDQAAQLCESMSNYGFNRSVLVSAANGFTNLSRQQDSCGHLEKAVHLAERAMLVSEKYGGGKQNYSYVDALTVYAGLLRKMGKVQQAAESETMANKIREELQRTGSTRYG